MPEVSARPGFLILLINIYRVDAVCVLVVENIPFIVIILVYKFTVQDKVAPVFEFEHVGFATSVNL